jgi:hypothetical protein
LLGYGGCEALANSLTLGSERIARYKSRRAVIFSPKFQNGHVRGKLEESKDISCVVIMLASTTASMTRNEIHRGPIENNVSTDKTSRSAQKPLCSGNERNWYSDGPKAF